MSAGEISFAHLPEDSASLKTMLRTVLVERDSERQRVEELQKKTEEQRKRADELYLENLHLQHELARYKKWYYGPRADR